MRSGDLNGDGLPDLVVARRANGNPFTPNSFLASTLIIRNLGNGTFAAPVALPAHATFDVELADVDSDGDLDLIEANSNLNGTESSALFLNDGAGTFTAAPFPTNERQSVCVGDIDQDGDVDLIMDWTISLNSGTGVFAVSGATPPPYFGSVVWPSKDALIDVDGDGDLDLVQADGRLLRRQPGGWGSWELLPMRLSIPVTAADFDRDGDVDLVGVGPCILTNTTTQLGALLPARLSRPASLELRAAPTTPWVLVAAAAPGSVALAPFGTVLIDPATAFVVGSGTSPASALTTISALAPSAPSAVGTTIYFQAVLTLPSGPRLSSADGFTIGNF